jgi:hypothetical protein
MYARMKMLPWFLGSVLVVAMIVTPATSAALAKAGYGIGAAGLVAGRDYVAGQVIVGLRPGVSFNMTSLYTQCMSRLYEIGIACEGLQRGRFIALEERRHIVLLPL